MTVEALDGSASHPRSGISGGMATAVLPAVPTLSSRVELSFPGEPPAITG